MNSKLLFLGLLYFVQGMPYGLQSSLLPIFLRTSGLSLTKISLTKALYFPWVLKVLWAPLVDQVGTKKKWLLASMSGLSLTCLASATLSPATDFRAVAGALLAMNFLASVQDIAVDGVAVRLLSRREEVGYGNTAQVVGYKLGSVAAGGGLLALVDALGWGWLFTALACVYAAVVLCTWRNRQLDVPLSESPTREGRRRGDASNPWAVWRELLAVPSTTWTVVFVLVYKLGEQGAVSMFPLFLLDHHMTSAELGFWNSVVAMGFSIFGSSLGGLLLSKYSLRSLMRNAFVLRLVSMAFQTCLLGFHSQSVLVKGNALQLPGHAGGVGEAVLQCPGWVGGGLGRVPDQLPLLPLPLRRRHAARLERRRDRGTEEVVTFSFTFTSVCGQRGGVLVGVYVHLPVNETMSIFCLV
ncbi:major facilitator superfamily domain-containing protein 3 isoform X1 [Conger conger]|uniref:major facilitator superfamily domain-containing protein 3 isoform X1 n=1 Tax=Conger conger TaxID=82655 RepID=UPI002A59F3CF|nr:major facilitator superfamily domain-containing protein 3 isoform X1 [Conger conger]XP_061117337.1 major facilitator superfamily domain-containing protein 3 isoform X1 [Conger conger]